MNGVRLGLVMQSATADGVLTPPTVAPVLSVTADVGGWTAFLTWSASNKTGSAGFGYRIEVNVNSGGWSLATTTTSLTYDYVTDGTLPGTYAFRITPYNNAGDGPVSNEASVILPGI